MKLTAGILAHVDAGKTTFSERVLYAAHAIRTPGRVDHQDTFLDTHPIERARGITVFSGQAHLMIGDREVYWVDTPGHADFSAEMERALSVMDYAVLIVSATEGVQSHTETVWELLRAYGVHVFVFINKCDLQGADPVGVLRQLRTQLSGDMLDLRAWQETGRMDETLQEEIAARDETLLEALFSTGFQEAAWVDGLTEQIRHRQCFPVLSGAALSGEGIDTFLRLFLRLTRTDYDARREAPLAARVWQIRHDARGVRLCFMKLMQGTLRVKDTLPGGSGEAKINELRLYHGDRYQQVEQAVAGDVVAIPGLDGLKPGDGLGALPALPFHSEPMMAADLLWDAKLVPVVHMAAALRTLEDEEPTLHVETQGERISLRVMGGIELEVLQQLIRERFGYEVRFGPCRVLYRETVAAPCTGIGHYEPLRHYAEVHLRLVPGKPGSGIRFRSLVHVDELALNWQRLIETHVMEKAHRGVLTGAPLTDVTVELLRGRAHLKHTEGGDFRQATYRAIRNALMNAQSVLLEPICGFELRIPAELYGTLTGALRRMKAELAPPALQGDRMVLRGEAPFSLFAVWQQDFMMLTHARGTLRVWMARYAPCHNAEEVISAAAYQPLADDTPDSVFCSHGAGFTVAWDHVRDFAHCSQEYPPVQPGEDA